jgi:hypothetical protein
MKTQALALSVLLGAQLLAGCDAQVGEDYRGEPLLTINGSVVIQNTNPPENLVPALAFVDAKQASFHFTDVEVTGEFPNRFTLDVFDPPPAASLYDFEDPGDENEPTYAMALITAVRADHAAMIPVQESGSVTCSSDSTVCTHFLEVCVPDGGCYRRVEECDTDGENCVVIEESGDPAWARSWLHYMAGLSTNYQVLYFPDGVKANTQIAYGLNGNQALAPGYYLVEVAEFSPAEVAEQEACMEVARQEALDRFNAKHGTAYKSWFEVPLEDANQYRETRLVAREQGCPLGTVHTRLVPDPAHQSITVTISPDVEPIGLK